MSMNELKANPDPEKTDPDLAKKKSLFYLQSLHTGENVFFFYTDPNPKLNQAGLCRPNIKISPKDLFFVYMLIEF